MAKRRDMLKKVLALAVGAGWASRIAPAFAHARRHGGRVTGVVRRNETIRTLGGMGHGYQMSWDALDRQYVAVNGGAGWTEDPETLYYAMLWSIHCNPERAAFARVGAYPAASEIARLGKLPRYVGGGLLTVQGRIYQFLSTLEKSGDRPRHWTGCKLIYSPDQGKTWHNRDGSTPVRWEDWDEQSRDSLTFFQEPDGCFSLISIAQMGRDYRANRDGYVYAYGVNGNVDGKMNELVMFRVRIADILDRKAYEYFAGRDVGGGALWSGRIERRAVVHRFPTGWVNRTNLMPGDLVVETWLPSVVYNEPLGLYMMASAGIGCAPDGTEFGKPSYLGFWVSENPWGPWRQIHEDTAWTPGGDRDARAYLPRISPKWISADGKSFWFVWSDIKGIREFVRDDALFMAAVEKATTPEEEAMVSLNFVRGYMPGLTFNLQRIDLVVDDRQQGTGSFRKAGQELPSQSGLTPRRDPAASTPCRPR